MSESKRIKTALVSVYHKEGLDEIADGSTKSFAEAMSEIRSRRK